MTSRATIHESMSLRARCTFVAHLFKACCKQHHKSLRDDFALILPPDGVALDIGAHAGQYSKLMAGIARQGHIWSIEPSSYAFAILRRALAFNRIRNVTPIRLGFGRRPGEAVLKMPVKPSGSLGFGLSHLGEATRNRRYVEETVPVTTVDRFVADHHIDRIDLIKADIEGWELQVLQGALETIERRRPVIFLELIEAFLTRAGDRLSDTWQLLADRGYAGYQFSGQGALTPAPHGSEGDLVFLPDGHPAGGA